MKKELQKMTLVIDYLVEMSDERFEDWRQSMIDAYQMQADELISFEPSVLACEIYLVN